MRILIATINLPWPVDEGGRAAQFRTLECLAEDHEFTLVAPLIQPGQEEAAAELARQLPRVRVRLVPCDAAPLVEKLTRRDRIIRLIRRLAAPILHPKKPAPPTPDVVPPPPDVAPPYFPFAPLGRSFIEAVSEELARGQDLVQAEYAEMMQLGPWLPVSIPKLLVHLQVHFVYSERYLQARPNGVFGRYLFEAMKAYEVACLRHFDGVVVFSKEDQKALEDAVPGLPIHVSPYPVPFDAPKANPASGDFGNRYVFVGADNHAPNVDAMEWMASDIWPRLRQRQANAVLEVIGNWSAPNRSRFSKSSGFVFRGFVQDLPAELAGKVMLVPLRVGSGIRTKILAAWASGAPVVSTTIGAEGLGAKAGEELLIADDAEGFADTVLRLATNTELRGRLASRAQEFVNTHYSPAAVRCRRNEVFDLVGSRHRAMNAARTASRD